MCVITCSRRPHNYKTDHFTMWKEREQLWNVKYWKMHVQSVQNYCFSLHICERSCFRRHRGCSSSLLLNRRTATWNRSICFIHYFPIVHNALCLPPQILHKLLLWNTLGRSAYSQEHSATMVYAKFGGQTECIMGNWKIENTIKKWKSEQWRHLCVCPPIGHR